eukprot:CAMPEP_0195063314 /NCGR_PEP_ID=MMETSP0448-20130528/9707_1 /TAXON_ID=66468 /ORGANISM="Heterocapsa triquestra, Strain CCMP 448" /LENGTH=50 /DNA_ID=CAMNT_0040094165 /DNA_START=19 /DNA_END=167 /DNA_ORIENTATION=+
MPGTAQHAFWVQSAPWAAHFSCTHGAALKVRGPSALQLHGFQSSAVMSGP